MSKHLITVRTFSILMVSLFFLTSCSTNKLLLNKDNFSSIPQIKISDAVAFERKIKSTNITPRHFIDIGEGIYPNKNNYELKVKTFKRAGNPGFELEVDYYYVVKVRVVKVILYQWEKSQDKNQDVLEDANIKSGRFVNFQNKFNQLRDSLTKSLGKPIDTNIEQKQESNQAFRDDVRWQGQDGTNAYLFMFVNNGTGYRQIRLAIYKD